MGEVDPRPEAATKVADVVNALVRARGYSAFLGIASSRGPAFEEVRCAHKTVVYVDARPAPGASVSDVFFEHNADKFDVVLIDGCHSCAQVLRDIDGALGALRPGGAVVLHDCLPGCASEATPEPHRGPWCGDAYKAVAWHFSRSPHLCYVVEADHGVGVVDTAFGARHAAPFPHASPEELTYAEFACGFTRLLDVVDPADLGEMVSCGTAPVRSRSPLYVVTATGDRLEAFGLCVRYMNRQTRRPDMWVIVDDGAGETTSALDAAIDVPHTVVRLPPMEGNSLARNMRAGLALVPRHAMLCVMEDDDWYAPDYLETTERLLAQGNRAVTVWDSRAYNVAYMRFMAHVRLSRAPLHGLSVCREGLFALREVVRRARGHAIDLAFARSWPGPWAHNYRARVVHVVGMPCARPGTTPAHRCRKGRWLPDPCGDVLRAWVGGDWRGYAACARADLPRFRRAADGSVEPCAPADAPAARTARGRVYVFSNVAYYERSRLSVSPDDVLVFLNAASSFGYYDGHPARIVVHRYPNRESEGYGREQPGATHLYIRGNGVERIPSALVRRLWAGYDKQYKGKPRARGGTIRSMTTGYIAAHYAAERYPDREVVLVNFGFDVVNSTHRSPAHNWRFEDEALRRFRHVFTDAPQVVQAQRGFTAFQAEVLRLTGAEWGDGSEKDEGAPRSRWGFLAVLDCSRALARYLEPLTGSSAPVLTVGFAPDGVMAAGLRTLLGDPSRVTCAATYDDAAAYAASPARFAVVLVQRGHGSADGMTELLPLVAPRGALLLVADSTSGDDADSLAKGIPGARVESEDVFSPQCTARMVVCESHAPETPAGR